MTITTAKWSLDDYHQMIAANILVGRQVELLNGEIIEMAPEGPEHAQISTDAADYLRELLGTKVLVREAKPITLPNSNSEPEPDIAIAQPLRALYRTRHPYPKNIFWLIEYANTSWLKDSEVKRQAYASANIQEYWIVNLKLRQVVALWQPEQGDYQQALNLTEGTLSPQVFPEVEISVQRLIEG
ncbi:Uma2 family endonuclease [Vacuolonema iberomarrocanum]|uniref:Uma2 family endonuclease n=1 Tax=Vacuolonema iberomarrocanum TaxID=3454632 RepID=UPI0019FDAF3F|nr:Uma2 family endonuclease [filamentous cyanobacterium LEGE 07170]